MRTGYASLLALFGVALAALPAHAFNTRGSSDKEVSGAITPERVKSDAEEQSGKLQESLPRRATFYSKFIIDAKEFAGLAKYNLFLFAVWTQKAAELPIKRIFIRALHGQEIPALNVSSWRTPVDQGSATAKRFGPYRQDGFYLFPSGAMTREGQIIMDLTSGASEMVMMELPSTVVAGWQGKILSGDPAPGAKPQLKALQDLIRREFPGFPVPTAVQ
jgi:hypothetical protein